MSDAEPETEPTAEDTVARATTLLGEPEAIFRASPRRQRTKLLAGCGLVIFGIIANTLWFTFGPGGVDHVLIHILYVPPAIGIALLWHMWRHRGLRVLVYPEGIVRLQHGEAMSFPWDDITSVRCKLDPQGEPRILRDVNGAIAAVWIETGVPNFQVWNVWLELTRSDGTTARFNAVLADFPDLVARVQRSTFVSLWANAQAALASGVPANFGDRLTVTPDSITSLKVRLAWDEVKSVTLSAKLFTVKKKRGWVAAIARDTTTILNLHVLLALAAERGHVEIEPEDD